MSRWRLQDKSRFLGRMLVTVDVDDALLEEYAEEINQFFGGAEERLKAAAGDVKRAAMLVVANLLLHLSITNDGCVFTIQREFDSAEGYPPGLIKVIYADSLDSLDYQDIEMTVVDEAPREDPS